MTQSAFIMKPKKWFPQTEREVPRLRDETALVLSALSGQEKYDEACKKTWMLKEIIAPVLQYTVKEYQSHSISEILGYINADSIADDVPLDDLPAVIQSTGTEFSSPTEKRVFFDIHFTAMNPDLSSQGVLIKLHIDFEIQNDYTPSKPAYPITKRAVYYAARELSSQLNVVTSSTNYDKLEKVYSIWICNETIPNDLKNTITRYHMEKEDIVGICHEQEDYLDLLEVIIIRRGAKAQENTLFEYLEGVFTTNLDKINKYVDVENNIEVKEALNTMCGLGAALENKGIEKGIAQGIEKGITQGKLLQLIDLVLSGDISEERASVKAGMSLEDFKKEMQELVMA